MIYLRLLMLGGALLAGWMSRGWLEDSRAIDQYQDALIQQRSEFEQVLSDYADRIEEEAAKSISLEQQNRALRDRVDGLREEISNATFPVENDGACPRHPVDSGSFRLLYDKAAQGGSPGTGSPDPSGVSPRDD